MKYILLLLLLFILSCTNNNDRQKSSEKSALGDSAAKKLMADSVKMRDHLPDEVVRHIDSMPVVPVHIELVILPNGKRLGAYKAELEKRRKKESNQLLYFKLDDPQDQLSQLITSFMSNAQFLVDPITHTYPAGPTANEPAQNGICYNYNSKTIDTRMKMYSDTCSLNVYGLDCSGFLYQVFKLSGCPAMLQGQAVDQSNINNLNAAISGVVTGVTATDMGKLEAGSIQTGDIIYWSVLKGSSASHIGIALTAVMPAGSIAVYQSNGRDGECQGNLLPTRGARTLLLSNPYWFGPDATWKVLRFSVQAN